MATPPFLRYLPARLKPLGNPAIWVPLTVFTLLSAFIWEYHNNPELFNRQPIGSLTPDSNLTPEEEARLAEIDNLDLLIEGSRVSGDAKTVTGQIQPVDIEGAAGTDGAGQPLADSDNPFAKYEEEYQFPGASANQSVFSNADSPNVRSAPSSTGRNATGANANSSAPRFNFGDGLVNPSAPSTNSALSDALDRQSADRAAAQNNGSNDSNGSSASSNAPNPASAATGSTEPQLVAPAAGTIPVPFIRTTPNMSPPAGGTGYQPPASSSLPAFNVAPQQVTPNPLNVQPGTRQQGQFAAPVAPVAQPSVETSPNGTSYTPPTFTQPDQGRAINPRR